MHMKKQKQMKIYSIKKNLTHTLFLHVLSKYTHTVNMVVTLWEQMKKLTANLKEKLHKHAKQTKVKVGLKVCYNN